MSNMIILTYHVWKMFRRITRRTVLEVLDLWRTEVTRVRKDLVRTYGKRKKMICQVTINLFEFPNVPILKIKV